MMQLFRHVAPIAALILLPLLGHALPVVGDGDMLGAKVRIDTVDSATVGRKLEDVRKRIGALLGADVDPDQGPWLAAQYTNQRAGLADLEALEVLYARKAALEVVRSQLLLLDALKAKLEDQERNLEQFRKLGLPADQLAYAQAELDKDRKACADPELRVLRFGGKFGTWPLGKEGAPKPGMPDVERGARRVEVPQAKWFVDFLMWPTLDLQGREEDRRLQLLTASRGMAESYAAQAKQALDPHKPYYQARADASLRIAKFVEVGDEAGLNRYREQWARRWYGGLLADDAGVDATPEPSAIAEIVPSTEAGALRASCVMVDQLDARELQAAHEQLDRRVAEARRASRNVPMEPRAALELWLHHEIVEFLVQTKADVLELDLAIVQHSTQIEALRANGAPEESLARMERLLGEQRNRRAGKGKVALVVPVGREPWTVLDADLFVPRGRCGAKNLVDVGSQNVVACRLLAGATLPGSNPRQAAQFWVQVQEMLASTAAGQGAAKGISPAHAAHYRDLARACEDMRALRTAWDQAPVDEAATVRIRATFDAANAKILEGIDRVVPAKAWSGAALPKVGK